MSASADTPPPAESAPIVDEPDAGLSLAPAFLGAALATLVLGALALLRVASPAADRWLTWRPAAEMVGPLAISAAVWLASWALLTVAWRDARVSRRVVLLCLALVALGLVLAFPPLDRLFA